MGDSTYDPSRMCYAPGTENRGLDPFRLRGEKRSSTFGDPYDPIGSPDWIYTLAEAKADKERAQQEYAKMLADSGLSDAEVRGLAAYVRSEKQYANRTPTDDDLENFVLAMRPQTPRNPAVVDVREYHIPGLWGGAIFTLKGVQIAVSMAADFVPVLGEVKVIVESVRGKDSITGDDIPTWARVLGPLCVAAGHASSVLKMMRAAGQLAKDVAEALKVRAGLRLMGPLLAVVAHMRVPPAEALRILDRLEQVDTFAARAAEAEATGAKGVLTLSNAQTAALRDASSLLDAEELAKMERASSRMGPSSLPKLPFRGNEAGTLDPLVAEDPAKKQKQRGRSPKKKAPKRPDPTRVFNKTIRQGLAAYRRLVKKGLRFRELTDKLKKALPYKFQMQVTGKSGEYVAEGRALQIDGVADSVTSPGKVDLIEAKFGFVEDIADSGHLAFGGKKIDQMERLAKFAAKNPDEIGKVIVVVGNLKKGSKIANVVGEVYLNLREALPEALRDLVEIVDEDFNLVSKSRR